MSTIEQELRIGDVAKLAGTTTRTIRYYEEVGLIGSDEERPPGAQRRYTERDVERLRHALRLKQLLGVSLDDLVSLLEAEEAREARRAEYRATDDPERRVAILRESLANVERQLALVQQRRADLDELNADLVARRERSLYLLGELDALP